jgi:histidinol-phosphate phosphatase family protein
VFLDRDGTLIEDRGHLQSPAEVAFFPQTVQALRLLRDRFLLFIVTNQRGIAEGLLSHDDADRVNAHVTKRLAEAGVSIAEVYVCPHRRSEGCACIKPNPHFLRRAAEEYRLDLRRSYAVGDHPHDVEFAHNVGACGIYVLTGHGAKHRRELEQNAVVVPGILEAARWIVEHRDARQEQSSAPDTPSGRPEGEPDGT